MSQSDHSVNAYQFRTCTSQNTGDNGSQVLHMPNFVPRRIVFASFMASWLALLPGALPKPPAKVHLKLKDLDGKSVRVQDLQGRIVVLNFWATWCRPCREELPLMVRSSQEYAGRDVLFVGASIDVSRGIKSIPGLIDTYHVTFPIWTGASLDDMGRLKMGSGVPATAFIDRDGQIVSRVSGRIQPGELRQRLEWLLSDRKDPAPEAFVNHFDHH
jgi:thiol-disulfide isomerase/thioredoxin